MNTEFETLLADESPEHRNAPQDTVVGLSLQPASKFAAWKWKLDGKEREELQEETRTKKTMVKQVKSRYEPSVPSRRRLSRYIFSNKVTL